VIESNEKEQAESAPIMKPAASAGKSRRESPENPEETGKEWLAMKRMKKALLLVGAHRANARVLNTGQKI
jgi:hypothetical protein